MTDFNDLVGSFQREVALPGSFATTFPLMTDSVIVATLMDAFAEAQLDGFFHTMSLDVDNESVSPDLSIAGGALVVIYAGIRVLRQQILAAGSRMVAKAGPVEYQTEQSASVAKTILDQLLARRKELLTTTAATPVYQIDGYAARGLGGFAAYEFPRGY